MFKYVWLTSTRYKHFRLAITKQGIYSSQNVTEICLWGEKNHQTVTLMLHVKCISAVGSESVICAGSYCRFLLAHPRQSSTCEIHGSCMLKLNAQPAFQQGLPNIPKFSVSWLQLFAVQRCLKGKVEGWRWERSLLTGVVLVSHQRNVDVTFMDYLLCLVRGF